MSISGLWFHIAPDGAGGDIHTDYAVALPAKAVGFLCDSEIGRIAMTNDSTGSKTRRGLWIGVTLIAGAIFMQGCITAAVVATVAIVGGSMGGYTATVEVDAPADRVYRALLGAVSTRPEVKITKQDDKDHKIKMERGKCKGSAEVTVKNGKTVLTVKAKSSVEDVSDEELAQRIVEVVCQDLGVEYHVVKEKGKKD